MQAVSSGPGQKTFIDLVWAPVTDVDLEGYNIFIATKKAPGSESQRRAAEDAGVPRLDVPPGKTYFYSVSAVDVRGNESARSEETERVPLKPSSHSSERCSLSRIFLPCLA